jgi:hypothetical protein
VTYPDRADAEPETQVPAPQAKIGDQHMLVAAAERGRRSIHRSRLPRDSWLLVEVWHCGFTIESGGMIWAPVVAFGHHVSDGESLRSAFTALMKRAMSAYSLRYQSGCGTWVFVFPKP